MQPLVSCLTATYGRHKVLQEAVSCFLEQDYDNKELIILNNHPEPLYCDLPQVTVYNEPLYETLGDCRKRLLQLANGELLRTWDDDDLYMPWAISQGVDNIGDSIAFKPTYSWDSRKNSEYHLGENVYEASITFRTDEVWKHGYKSSGGDEHDPLMRGIHGKCKLLPVRPSYCYRWDSGLHRISGTLGSEDINIRTKQWMSANNDTGDNVIRQVGMGLYWKDIEDAENRIFHSWGNKLLQSYADKNTVYNGV